MDLCVCRNWTSSRFLYFCNPRDSEALCSNSRISQAQHRALKNNRIYYTQPREGFFLAIPVRVTEGTTGKTCFHCGTQTAAVGAFWVSFGWFFSFFVVFVDPFNRTFGILPPHPLRIQRSDVMYPRPTPLRSHTAGIPFSPGRLFSWPTRE